MTWTTPDLCDQFPDVQVAEPVFRSFGGQPRFAGPAVTVKCLNDNSRVRELAMTPGEGRVIVVDGGGSLRRALLGDLIAGNAVKNGWSGFVIFGCVRDVEVLATLPLGVQALASHPMKTDRRDLGEVDVPVSFAGVSVTPGDWIYADANGVLVANAELHEA
ncbi:ribonuclease E activity regulator RraA [Pseudoxanthomonas sp. PXM02]|uniref:ribonuclease E activity regulator RraA n=1 Tax=Pseudoxanthomonas sp. PXM02 TaxID=2769294 RepID=UPI00177BF248|nr:ribonuclease E activity regulator RraA [Pseudoxanthomonas sp. PXM02]MBD9478187.1 ribonuclease E activity regulator RraA [Pseudoxanthomonas sp. PXM02]